MGFVGLAASGVAGYLLGSLPSADLAARLATGGRVDLRHAGSGNPGGANAVKVLGPAWGYGIMAADIGKATAAGVLGRRLAGDAGANLAGTASVVGHCFPVWNGFRGGKGVACSVGQAATTFPVYVPADLAVAWVSASRRFRQRSYVATAVASGAWVGAALLWWRRRWPTGFGPATGALPLAAAASSAVILYKFATAPAPPAEPPPPRP